jgi:hypothetical protein
MKWGRGTVHTEFWWGNLKERGHFEDLGLHGIIILKWVFQNLNWGVDRNKWRAAMNAVMNRRVP